MVIRFSPSCQSIIKPIRGLPTKQTAPCCSFFDNSGTFVYDADGGGRGSYLLSISPAVPFPESTMTRQVSSPSQAERIFVTYYFAKLAEQPATTAERLFDRNMRPDQRGKFPVVLLEFVSISFYHFHQVIHIDIICHATRPERIRGGF